MNKSTAEIYLSVFIVAASWVPAALLARPAAAEEQPRLVILEREYNFGTVAQGKVVEHGYPIRNAGSAPLKITRISPDCGCVAVSSNEETVPPQGQVDIRVSYNTAGYRGEKAKNIRIYTNDPDNSSAVLLLRGIIKADVEVEPGAVDFGSVASGRSYEQEVFAFPDPESGVKLLEARAHSEDLEVSSEDVEVKGRAGKKLKVTLKKTTPVGTFRNRIALKTTSSGEPVVNIPVRAVIEGTVRFDPPAVTFGTVSVPLQRPLIITAKLINLQEGPLRIVDISTDRPSLKVEATAIEEGKQYELRLTLDTSVPEIIRGRVKITTDNPDKVQRTVTLPVYALVVGKNDSE